MEPPPFTPTEPVSETLHGRTIIDPFRWLEDQDSPRTRKWLEDQTSYARAYFDNLPNRDRIRLRIRQFLAVESYDSLQKVGSRYFFRKRLPEQEQPGIYMREGVDGEDRLLLDPASMGASDHIAVKPCLVSPDGRLLLYEIKEGGERTGTFRLFDVETGSLRPEVFPRGHLYGFAFSPDGNGCYYVHEPLSGSRRFYRAVYHHLWGRDFSEDREVFCVGEDERIYLGIVSDTTRLGILVYKVFERILVDFYLVPFGPSHPAEPVLKDVDFQFTPLLASGRLFALTDHGAPNFRVVEILRRSGQEFEFVDIVRESDARIEDCQIIGDRICVCYIQQTHTKVTICDFSGAKISDVPVREDETARFIASSRASDELFLEQESFTEPIATFRYSPTTGQHLIWAPRGAQFDASQYSHMQVWYSSKDATPIPMFLMGRRETLTGGTAPVIMTSYGGFGLSMTPQFSVFVAFLVERGCIFALPNIRGGSEFGVQWHNSAKRRNRQIAYDDFLGAAEWLVETGRTTPDRLAIFGGSNSGLLVGAALTQRPDLFRAVVCMVPLLDMLRYHLFDNANFWQEEFGTADNPEDFTALLNYSPYHQVRPCVAYPATMIVSGDADRNCNPLHARKMTARLQNASISPHPILLAYSKFRGHAPVLPLSERIEALTDRMAFLCDQLQLSV
jgi:prolyl oligopeptidase